MGKGVLHVSGSTAIPRGVTRAIVSGIAVDARLDVQSENPDYVFQRRVVASWRMQNLRHPKYLHVALNREVASGLKTAKYPLFRALHHALWWSRKETVAVCLHVAPDSPFLDVLIADHATLVSYHQMAIATADTPGYADRLAAVAEEVARLAPSAKLIEVGSPVGLLGATCPAMKFPTLFHRVRADAGRSSILRSVVPMFLGLLFYVGLVGYGLVSIQKARAEYNRVTSEYKLDATTLSAGGMQVLKARRAVLTAPDALPDKVSIAGRIARGVSAVPGARLVSVLVADVGEKGLIDTPDPLAPPNPVSVTLTFDTPVLDGDVLSTARDAITPVAKATGMPLHLTAGGWRASPNDKSRVILTVTGQEGAARGNQ